MASAVIYNMAKDKVGEVDLPDHVFAVPVKRALLHEAVRQYLSNQRLGAACTKTRSKVRGGGKKPYRQKGTGRARHGSIRSPLFVGGGRAFGPKPRDWHYHMPEKACRLAVKMALSVKLSEGRLFVVDKWVSDSGKTKDMAEVVKKWGVANGLIVQSNGDEKTRRAIRNIPNMKMVPYHSLNIYDLLRHEHILVTEEAVRKMCEKFSPEAKTTSNIKHQTSNIKLQSSNFKINPKSQIPNPKAPDS